MDNQRKLRVFEGFSGYGSHSLQLKAMGIPHEVVGTSEIDTYAIVAYSAVHDNFAEVGDVSHEDMLKYLQDRNIGYDFKKDRFPNMTKKRIEQTYSAAIGQKCYGDISLLNVNDLPDMDLFTYSYPCQDISISGLQKGLDKNSGTRSSLLWECQKVIEGKRPAFAMMENVKNLIGQSHRHNFDKWLEWMESMGYNNYWKVINSKHCGIPQNRERVFLVSIRKDIDDGNFEFEEDFDSGLRLKDFLEDKVDEKYYIENERVGELLKELSNKDLLDGKRFYADSTINDPNKREISNCITGRYDAGIQNQKQIGLVVAEPNEKIGIESTIVASRGRYTDGNATEQQLEPRADGCSNTITTVQKDNMILENNNLQFVGGIGDKDWVGDNKEFSRNYPQGNRVYDIDGVACSQTSNGGGLGGATGLYLDKSNEILVVGNTVPSGHSAGRVMSAEGVSPTVMYRNAKVVQILDAPNELKLHTNLSGGKWDKIHESARRVYDENGISPTIPTCGGGNIEPKTYTNYRIRKLTPRECFRLMGLTEGEIDKIQASDISNSQQYKLAGNSIVKQCMTFLKNLPFDRLDKQD